MENRKISTWEIFNTNLNRLTETWPYSASSPESMRIRMQYVKSMGLGDHLSVSRTDWYTSPYNPGAASSPVNGDSGVNFRDRPLPWWRAPSRHGLFPCLCTVTMPTKAQPRPWCWTLRSRERGSMGTKPEAEIIMRSPLSCQPLGGPDKMESIIGK